MTTAVATASVSSGATVRRTDAIDGTALAIGAGAGRSPEDAPRLGCRGGGPDGGARAPADVKDGSDAAKPPPN
eukprot:CAMPEP_0184383516 /NCGR_PEP_ID=MMETSP0007-20130409/7204_1 /TAXON_ID=97485 /ORGANISM="Prymnesium parvum, Strain Texoma1" /LENGTH=72 /DNA_ID=CAMNT_0026730033 /DNA_START=773 /DNA_END=988 /DNA_ORIENTATION=+